MMQIGRGLYKNLVRPVLFSLDEERAHALSIRALRILPRFPLRPDPPELAVKLWDRVEFSNPIGLAAGADKNAARLQHWKKLGFGFQEVGTITPEPQPGNLGKRLQRQRDALVNRMGFPSDGLDKIHTRLIAQRPRAGMPIALNLGPNKDTPAESVVADYERLLRKLAKLADFVVVNVSSPNTPGLRNWQAPDRIASIFGALREISKSKSHHLPLLIKIAPDLDSQQLQEICLVARKIGIDGIVATNTTVERNFPELRYPIQGGVSGRPLKAIALGTVRKIFRETDGKIPIIGVGGIFSAEDAFDYIRAGASLVELYTGLVFEGITLVRLIKQGLIGLIREHGFRSISEAIGSESRNGRVREAGKPPALAIPQIA